MALSAQYRSWIEDLFEPLALDSGDVRVREMFGGAGVFYRGVMFALIANQVIYFKADASTQPDFDAHNCGPFVYERSGRAPVVMSYWRLPEALLEEPETMLIWARRAIDVAFAAYAAKGKRPSTKRKLSDEQQS